MKRQRSAEIIILSDDDNPQEKTEEKTTISSKDDFYSYDSGVFAPRLNPRARIMESFVQLKPSAALSERQQRLTQAGIRILAGGRSATIVDRGSIFQSFVVQSDSLTLALIRDVIRELCRDYVISKAAHPAMHAYRILCNGQVNEGFDDNGEEYSGSKILAVLRKHDVRNVVAIVTRWFGGVLLGPIRFQHISHSTESCLKVHHLIPDEYVSFYDKTLSQL